MVKDLKTPIVITAIDNGETKLVARIGDKFSMIMLYSDEHQALQYMAAPILIINKIRFYPLTDKCTLKRMPLAGTIHNVSFSEAMNKILVILDDLVASVVDVGTESNASLSTISDSHIRIKSTYGKSDIAFFFYDAVDYCLLNAMHFSTLGARITSDFNKVKLRNTYMNKDIIFVRE